MFETLSTNFKKYNNDNNVFICTNITYFPKLLSCPDIPAKSFDESLTKAKVTRQEYAQLTTKMKASCNNFIVLTILWALRWLTRLIILYFLVNSLMNGWAAVPYASLVGVLLSKLVLFLISYLVIEKYRLNIQDALNVENDSTYKSRNLYWRIISGCSYIHLVLNYSHFSCRDTIVSLDSTELGL